MLHCHSGEWSMYKLSVGILNNLGRKDGIQVSSYCWVSKQYNADHIFAVVSSQQHHKAKIKYRSLHAIQTEKSKSVAKRQKSHRQGRDRETLGQNVMAYDWSNLQLLLLLHGCQCSISDQPCNQCYKYKNSISGQTVDHVNDGRSLPTMHKTWLTAPDVRVIADPLEATLVYWIGTLSCFIYLCICREVIIFYNGIKHWI